MPEYAPVVKRSRRGSARAKDFYDIHALVSKQRINVASRNNLGLIRNIFQAKRVAPQLLGLIANTREFHRVNFAAVKEALKPGEKIEEFDFYFDFVLRIVERLKPFWNE
jgi:hypothetical protein